MSKGKIKVWLGAMRLHTLPVSIAGVITGGACAVYFNGFNWLPFTICMLFAIGAQIVSNFANEYFDYRKGLDKRGREGFRRGVTEGDLSPIALRNATFGLLAAVCALGCSLIYWGGWWLIAIGVLIALFALAYSAGPYPLSHHGLGEIAVIIFFGIVPVMFTCYVEICTPLGKSGAFELDSFAESWKLTLPMGVAIGLLGADVLIVNNYRDMDDDRAVGKHTLAVRFGPKAMERLYLISGITGLLIIGLAMLFAGINTYWEIGVLLLFNIHWLTWQMMKQSEGKELNAVLGRTAMLMPIASLLILLSFIFK